jgi:hypothetical protein
MAANASHVGASWSGTFALALDGYGGGGGADLGDPTSNGDQGGVGGSGPDVDDGLYVDLPACYLDPNNNGALTVVTE